jgi:diacylglycerol kinase family enzyme
MRLLLLVNTSASSVTPRSRVVIQKALAADHDLSVSETSRRGHAARLAQGAVASGVDAVVVLGGDGTLNEAANGLAGSTTALGVLPGGSTNVFARTVGVLNDPIEATGQLLSALARGSTRRIGLGTVNDRYFLFHVGMGFDAAVVEQVERRAALKRYTGHALFVYAAFATFFRHYDRSRPRFAVRYGAMRPVPSSHAENAADAADAQGDRAAAVIDDAYLAICLKTNPYTFLGNMPLNLAPEAGFDRGLSLVAFRSLDFTTTIGVVVSALRTRPRRRETHRRRVVHVSDRDDIVVTGYGPFPYQVDGDYLGDVESLHLRFVPDALTLIAP